MHLNLTSHTGIPIKAAKKTSTIQQRKGKAYEETSRIQVTETIERIIKRLTPQHPKKKKGIKLNWNTQSIVVVKPVFGPVVGKRVAKTFKKEKHTSDNILNSN